MLDIESWSYKIVKRKRKVKRMIPQGILEVINPRKDFAGNDLNVGDKVAFIVPRDRRLGSGEIIDFTKQMIRIKTGVTEHWKTKEPYVMTELREPRGVVKINA